MLPSSADAFAHGSSTLDTTESLCPAGDECPYFEEVQALRAQVVTDPLTGLFNLRYFREALIHELERTQRTGLATALMMIDLDHFKRVNDKHGHEAGNLVLQHVARLIRENTRRLDVQCRYGGEEFVVILPSTEPMLAVQVAERLRESIETTAVIIGQDRSPLLITASLGLAFHQLSSDIHPEQFVDAADKQLYRAKSQGRNQVCYTAVDVSESAVSASEKDLVGALFSEQIQQSGPVAENEIDAGDFDARDFDTDAFVPPEPDDN